MPISIREYLNRGPATSREIQHATGLSQGAVSRRLRRMNANIIRLGGGRSPRYAATRNAFGGDDRLPLYMVDAHGNNAAVAYIRPLAPGGFFVEPLTGMPTVLAGARQDCLYDDLPYFLYDLAPQGFIGRQIAEEMATRSDDFPNDPRNWTMDHIGRYLVSNGDDLPGNFKFGEQAHLRVRRRPAAVTPDEYPELAESIMSGIIPGSSAGGEQPKFTAFCGERLAHVIVKFSPRGADPVASRWRDILITEFHATEAIHAKNFPAAETRLIERGGRLFLESKRFDRSGEYGRMPMISLRYVDAEFTGVGQGWHRAMDRLAEEGLVSGQHCLDAMILWAFGLLINNTDMHLGNLSLSIDGGGFRILPVYDMCSMGFAPKAGDVLPYSFVTPDLDAQSGLDAINKSLPFVRSMAHDFWARVAGDDRISSDFRRFLAQGNPIARTVSP
ncbi:MAG: type II toxin-antitoxin system HipA family toxin YjjJ [Lentisphaerae bacterium]|nr:type II toxin-antitoxin system HipA family toxin YjjJ [Lentisphaerota bacterium]